MHDQKPTFITLDDMYAQWRTQFPKGRQSFVTIVCRHRLTLA